MFSDIPFCPCTVLAVPPHKLCNAEWNRKFAAVRRQALSNSMIEINRFSQCSVLTVHHCSKERIHQNQPGALHNLQPLPILISHSWECNAQTWLCIAVRCQHDNTFRPRCKNRWKARQVIHIWEPEMNLLFLRKKAPTYLYIFPSVVYT